MGMLRLFLSLSVVIYHIPQRSFTWLNASVAVLVFFMISGFYMALVINDKYSKTDLWQWRFYLNRLGRLFPAYLAVLLFGVLWLYGTSSPTVFTSNLQLGFWKQLCLIYSNLFIFGQDMFNAVLMTNADHKHNVISDSAISFLGAGFFQNQFMIIGQVWSVAMELVFYLLAPIFVRKIRNILVILALSIAIRAYIQWHSLSFPREIWGYWFFPSTISFFCLGCLGYFTYKKLSCLSWGKNAGFMLCGILLCWAVISIRSGGILNQGIGYDSVYHWLFFLCIAIMLPFIFLISKDSYLDRLVGELSYPIYLIHGFVIGIALNKLGLTRGSFLSEIIIILCSIGIAALIYQFIDKPVDHYRRYIETAPLKPILKSASVILALFIAIGMATGIRTQFLPPSFPPPVLVSVVGKFNIVQFKELYFGIPPGLAVDWEKDDVSKLPGVLTNNNKDNLLMQLPGS